MGIAKLCGKIADSNCDGLNENGGKMFLAEFLGTFLFVSVNVNVIYNNGSKDIILNAIIIGIALILGLMIAAPISGASINPAVGLVLPIFRHIVDDVSLSHMWIHFIGPLVGGAAAGLFQLSYVKSLSKIEGAACAPENDINFRAGKVDAKCKK